MTTMLVAFDPGSSLTKVVYSVDYQPQKLMTMASETLALKDEKFQRKIESRGNVGVISGINDAYVKYRKRDSITYVVGHLASQFNAEADLSRSKYELGVPKFLAAIGAIAEQEECSLDEPLDVVPVLLLPYGEFVSQGDFVSQIEGRGKRYYFRGRKISLHFPGVHVMPEGTGLFSQLVHGRGAEWIEKREAVCFLMVGHRNASFLTFRYGRLDRNQSGTSDWGFVRLVDSAVEYSAGQNRQRLTRDIYELGDEIEASHPILRSLTRTKETENVNREAAQLADAISAARDDYWRSLSDWMGKIAPRRINSLVVAGGGAFYMRSEIAQHFDWANLEWQVADAENPLLSGHPNTSLQHRISDVSAAFESHFKDSIRDIGAA